MTQGMMALFLVEVGCGPIKTQVDKWASHWTHKDRDSIIKD